MSSKHARFHSLSNIQIDNYYRFQPLYCGTFSRTNLPKTIEKKGYIVNLDSAENSGTHWLSISNIDPNVCYYFDSYGIVEIPIEIKKFMKTSNKPIICNHIDLQAINTESCGEFCIFALNCMMKGQSIDDVVSYFTSNPVINEHILLHQFGAEAFTKRSIKKSIKKHKLDGEGIRQVIDWMKHKAKAVQSTVVEVKDRIQGFVQGPRQAQSPLIRTFLSNHGQEKIIAIRVCRSPIVSFIDKLANIVSLGQWEANKRSMNYDKMFHLFLLLRTDTGSCYKLEKNQNLNVGSADWNQKAEFLPVLLGSPLNANLLFKNAESHVDHKRLYAYDPVTSNCQRFCHDILKSSNLMSSGLDHFILQNAEQVLKHLGLLEKAMKGITNGAARADILINGNGIHRMILYKPKINI